LRQEASLPPQRYSYDAAAAVVSRMLIFHAITLMRQLLPQRHITLHASYATAMIDDAASASTRCAITPRRYATLYVIASFMLPLLSSV